MMGFICRTFSDCPTTPSTAIFPPALIAALTISVFHLMSYVSYHP
jgi:hypothetical protein